MCWALDTAVRVDICVCAIVVMFHAGYLITPGIVAVVARHVGVILWPTDKISIFTGSDGSPRIYPVSLKPSLRNEIRIEPRIQQ